MSKQADDSYYNLTPYCPGCVGTMMQVPPPNTTGSPTGGTPGQGGATFGDYGGAAPNFTPGGGQGLAVDTSTGAFWMYYNGAWH